MKQTHPAVPLAVDVIASGIHDAKNNLFDAMTRIESATRSIREGRAEAALPLLAETEHAVLSSAERLSKLLSAYRLTRHENPITLMPINISELLEDTVLRVAPHRHDHLSIETQCAFDGFWVCDRELVADSLVNALQNALRHARSTIRISAAETPEGLMLSVADDGPGIPEEMPVAPSGEHTGVGLYIAHRIAQLHERNGRHGHLNLFNGAPLGGAVFQLLLP